MTDERIPVAGMFFEVIPGDTIRNYLLSFHSLICTDGNEI